MKLTLERASLLAAIARAVRAVERRNTIPILANVLLRVTADTATIIATDLDIQISVVIEGAKVDAPGETTLPGHKLHEIVRKLPEGAQVSIEDDGKGQTTLKAGRSRFKLQSLPPSDFPDLATVEEGFSFQLRDTDLAAAIGRVSFAISTEETRYYLNGIYFHAFDAPGQASMLRLVATDGHRLSMASIAAPAGSSGMHGVIIPRKAVTEIERLAGEGDGADIEIEVSAHKMAIAAGGTRIFTKLIDGTFPDYGRVIPQGGPITARMAASELAAAVDRVGTVSSEKGRAIKCDFAADTLTVSVANPDAGDASDEVSATISGEGEAGITIGFNGHYVLDMLAAMKAKGPVEFTLTDPGSPAVVREVEGPDALCVLMPMRV